MKEKIIKMYGDKFGEKLLLLLRDNCAILEFFFQITKNKLWAMQCLCVKLP